MPVDVTPHPIVVSLAGELADENAWQAVRDARDAAEAAAAVDKAATEWVAARALEEAMVNAASPPRAGAVAEALGGFGVSPAGKDLSSFAGYCGGSVEDPLTPMDPRWQVLFLDANFSTWLIFKTSDIKLFNRMDEDTALGGQRDYLWVPGDALVGRGDTSTSAEAVVRSGTFSRAGDLATSLRRGDTNARRSGLMVDSVTPSCCGRYSR